MVWVNNILTREKDVEPNLVRRTTNMPYFQHSGRTKRPHASVQNKEGAWFTEAPMDLLTTINGFVSQTQESLSLDARVKACPLHCHRGLHFFVASTYFCACPQTKRQIGLICVRVLNEFQVMPLTWYPCGFLVALTVFSPPPVDHAPSFPVNGNS